MKNIIVKSDDFIRIVKLNNIYFFTRVGKKTIVVLKDRQYELNLPLYSIINNLSSNFLRTHKSYIINIDKVDKISKYSSTAYDIQFKDIKAHAYITKRNLQMFKERVSAI